MRKKEQTKKATIKDVAQRSGTTPAIVSRVFNHDATLNIKEETRNNVLNAISELDYRPNAVARSLRTRSMKTIGVLITDIVNPFYASIIKGIQEAALEEDYCVILCDTNDNPQLEKRFIETLASQFVDGIILTSAYVEDSVIDLIENSGIKYVMVNRASSNSNAPYVKTNDIDGVMMAVRHLVSLGHSKIAYISGPLYAETAINRLTGYRRAIKEAEITYNNQYMVESAFAEKAGYDACQMLLQLKDRPTAICTSNDLQAIGAMRAIKDAGLSIPDDISLVGFNNIWISSILAPPLTTIDTPLFEMGKSAFNTLFSLIGNAASIPNVNLPTKLVVRGSTSVPKNEN